MVSDPVRGLARRHGSVLQAEKITAPGVPFADLVGDTAFHKVFPFTCDGQDYDLIYRSKADGASLGAASFAWCYNKGTRSFLPIVYNGDAALSDLISGGVSAAVNVGRFIYLAGNTVIPTYTETDLWGSSDNQKRMAIWVRGGAYSRTFTATLTTGAGTKVVASYKTVSSSYPELLDTSDLSALDEEYQKKINDRVNAYNSEVTKWIGTAAADITPENIAQKLVDSFVSQGVTGVSRVNGTVIIDNAGYVEVSSDDGGDGSLLRAVGNEVSNIDLVSTTHFVGKLVKVVPNTDSKSAIYLQAHAKDKVSTGWAEVVWREAAGYVMTPDVVFIHGTVEDGTLYLASSPSGLQNLSGVECPGYEANEVGDQLSCPLPQFFGRAITYLGLFQDRLVIGSGATIFMSRNSDYLNWFRRSVGTLVDTDPLEGFALGAEDDVIRHGTLYDRNLVLYGEQFEFIISGRQPATPLNFSVVVVTAYEDAADAAPQVSGNLVFYSRYSGEDDSKLTSLHQVQAGLVADSPESYNTSQALDTYLKGLPVEILAMTAPNLVVLRTSTDRNKVYTYSYLDSANGSERLFDSWSHWEWHTALGVHVGISRHHGGVLVYMLRTGLDRDGTARTWIACERFTRDTVLSRRPYADSLRPFGEYLTQSDTTFINGSTQFAQAVVVAIDGGRPRRFIGCYLPDLPGFISDYPDEMTHCHIGVEYPAYVTPTNPYPLDRNGRPILAGRMTLGKVTVSVADTGGCTISKRDSTGTTVVLSFSGYILGNGASVIGTQPVVSTSVSAWIGGEIRACSYTIAAKRWLPLTVTAIEWTGQHFNTTRRA